MYWTLYSLTLDFCLCLCFQASVIQFPVFVFHSHITSAALWVKWMQQVKFRPTPAATCFVKLNLLLAAIAELILLSPCGNNMILWVCCCGKMWSWRHTLQQELSKQPVLGTSTCVCMSVDGFCTEGGLQSCSVALCDFKGSRKVLAGQVESSSGSGWHNNLDVVAVWWNHGKKTFWLASKLFW